MEFYEYLKSLTSLRQKQIRHAVFVNLIDNPAGISTIGKEERDKIALTTSIVPFKLADEQKSKDGSTKWLLELEDGAKIETVLMEFRDGRSTVCISSQVGCPSGCVFCATGQLGFRRNLSLWEIVSQVLFAARQLKVRDKKLTNVVFMGMGEPFLNFDNVVNAIKEINDPNYFNLGRRHITLSTCGIISSLDKFIEADLGVTLAISLHAPNQRLREELMPISRSNPLKKLFTTLDRYVDRTNKRVSYEYLMLEGVNDSEKDAEALAELLEDRLAFVNLINFNEISSTTFKSSSRQRVDRFKSILERHHVPTTVRVSLGEEISAACGQLAGEN
jgi:23S rRNA (adenine2503-C2)-methyltransferase